MTTPLILMIVLPKQWTLLTGSDSILSEYGFYPTLGYRLRRKLFQCITRGLRISGSTRWSNEFIQSLDPQISIYWTEGKWLRYRTGHGRLLWRCQTFFDEEPLMIDWLRTFSNEDVFLEVGANVGLYTIPAAIQGSRTYAIELDLLNCAVLQENVVLNKVTHLVTIFPVALGKTNEFVQVFYRDFTPRGGDALQAMAEPSNLDRRHLVGAYSLIQPVITGESLLSCYGLIQPTKVKIDVDGNERFVWPGIREIVFRASEVYIELGNDDFSIQIFDDLRVAGFRELKRQQIARLGNSANVLFGRKSD